MGIKGRRTSSKNPPIFSNEFIIQNHADIVSCIAMLFVIGLMFQVTAPVASLFIAVHHNATDDSIPPELREQQPTMYTYGWKDSCAVFFYLLICIVMHAIIQEYVLDKINRKLHLSKVKHSKFNESGQLLVFYVMSVIWGADIIFRENLVVSLPSLWEGYPHSRMLFIHKFFFIVQLAYWLHCFPELYFQRIKREEMAGRVRYAVLYLVFIGAAYALNFTRVALCLLVLHYLSESIFHASKLLYFAERVGTGTKGFMIGNIVFVLVRLGSIILSVLTFWYGLALSEPEGIDYDTGNFNSRLIRLSALASVCLLQAWLMWNFITFHLRRMREQAALQTSARKTPAASAKKGHKKPKKEDTKRGSEEDVSELPEVDQNTKKTLRARSVAQKAK